MTYAAPPALMFRSLARDSKFTESFSLPCLMQAARKASLDTAAFPPSHFGGIVNQPNVVLVLEVGRKIVDEKTADL